MTDLRQLTYFVAVVEAKSFTGAAEVLHIAQPALSQHIQRLEHDFGQQLLVRHSRGIAPTAAGLRLVEHAREILSMVGAAKEGIRNFTGDFEASIRVGMPQSLVDAFGVELIERWNNEHPNIHLHFVEQPSNTLNEWLLAGRLDIAVSSFPSEPGKLAAEPLVQDKFCALVPRTDDRAPFSEIRLTELADYPLILPSATNVSRQLIELTAKYASLSLDVRFEIDSPWLSIKMVIAGMGATIQPYLAARRHIDHSDLDVRVIMAPGITRRLHIIRPAQRSMPPKVAMFRTVIREMVLRLADSDSRLVELEPA